jgi:hypothetical protein
MFLGMLLFVYLFACAGLAHAQNVKVVYNE